ncbi:efflux RND transporter permease subunit [Bacillus sp. FJAT-26390]|uniref:MMPL family transporter n=1 Tax=Bacillus sp. FJAT-26390 TaxID=1743142 RepID=UPI000807EF4A|nr:MMPL family transporter [Bacillus sp. FJAT-26390]OBZ07683.1 MMPL family protein [Bacillus sp. FJAT-26390]
MSRLWLAQQSFRFPRGMILLWAIVLLVIGSQAFKLDSVLQDHGLYPKDGQYAKVQQMLASDFAVPESPVMLVFEKADGISKARFRSFIEQALVQAKGLEGLTGIFSPLEQQGMMKGNNAYALLSFSYPPYRMLTTLEQLDQKLPTYNGISVKVTGKSAVQADVNQASHYDLARAELIGIPLAFLILWLVFRSIAAALIPIVIGVAGVTTAMGIMYRLGTQLELSNFVLNVVPMVGLALSIDFALMVISRFREELSEGTPPAAALAQTMRTAGRAVFVSAASVFLGLLSFVWIPLPMFSSIALGAMTVVAVSLLLSFTLLPALLALCLPALWSNKAKADSRPAVWNGVVHFVMRRPAAIGLLAGGVLIVCLLPLSSMKVAIPDASSLPQSYDSRTAAETYRTHFELPSTSKVWVIAEGQTGFRKQKDWTSAYALAKSLERDPSVIRVDSVFSELRLSPEQLLAIAGKTLQKKKYESVLKPFLKDNRMLLQVTITGEPSSNEAMSWLRNWEKRGEISTLAFSLGGEAKYEQEVFDLIFGSLRYVLLFLFASNFIVLFVAFRSVLIAIKTILLNLLSIGAAFGILAWIFEEGRLGMEPSSIAVMIPVFICGLVFGISMDYGVFLVSRIYEEYRRTGDNEQSVITGLTSVSKIITSAAAIMIAVTAPFAFGEVAGVKQLGIGIAAAIFIDATIIRMLLVPSLMSLLGKWNWWAPRWLK